MPGYNTPVVLPYRPTAWEQTRPALLNFLGQLGLMKLGQQFQAKQAAKTAETAKATAETAFKGQMMEKGWESLPVQPGQDPAAIPGAQQGPFGGWWRQQEPTIRQITIGGKALPGKYTYRVGSTVEVLDVPTKWGAPQVAGADDQFGLPEGTVYGFDPKTNKPEIFYKPEGYKPKTKAEAIELKKAGRTQISIGEKVEGAVATEKGKKLQVPGNLYDAALKSLKSRLTDKQRLEIERDPTKKEELIMKEMGLQAAIKKTYPNAQLGQDETGKWVWAVPEGNQWRVVLNEYGMQ